MHKDLSHRLNRKLELAELLDWLVADGLANAADADKLKLTRRAVGKSELHPLVIIATQKWKSPIAPHPPLDQEMLSEWLA